MASKHTTNYQLNQWEAADKVLRTDFNADNAKIDAALLALQRAVDAHGIVKAEGTYTGVYPSYTVNTGFRPSLVILAVNKQLSSSTGTPPAFALLTRNFGVTFGVTGANKMSDDAFKINSDGFTIGQSYSYNNFSYHYFAIK